MSVDVSRRLERLEAYEAIRQLIATYAVGADRKNDPAILAPLFHDDAVWEADGVARYEGRDVIAAGLSDLGQTFVTWSLHYMVAPKIDVASDVLTASCRWYLWELCTMVQPDGTSADTWLGGWYDSTLSIRSGDWRFDHVTLDMRLQSPRDVPWTGKKT
ncbi:MAG: nuclear transport factor 2 family protein [Pseudomonadota bacterium]